MARLVWRSTTCSQIGGCVYLTYRQYHLFVVISGFLRAKILVSHSMKKNIFYRQRRREEVVYDDCIVEDFLSKGDRHIEEDPSVNYDLRKRTASLCGTCLEAAHDKIGKNLENHRGIVGKSSPARWGDLFVSRMDQLRAQLHTAQGLCQRQPRKLRTCWMTMAGERNGYKRCWSPHVQSRLAF
ncbi:hypothetical protein RB195_011334 [Necator americanus]|uniref:Uncharacterized protein n=1 Tax=Necator americanus TaxID=51031 RepID=A0ABR1D1W8_NECAM